MFGCFVFFIFLARCVIDSLFHLFDERPYHSKILYKDFSVSGLSETWLNDTQPDFKACLIKEKGWKLQRVQNFAARIITDTRKFDHMTPALRDLSWLPVISTVVYTVGILPFKCVEGSATESYVHDHDTRNKNSFNIPA